MDTKELTSDAKAILLLCGRFTQNENERAAKALNLTEYNGLADALLERGLRPADLLTDIKLESIDLRSAGLDARRLQALLERGVSLALAVENWMNKSIWIICRSDPTYPERLKQHLKKLAPPILYGAGDPGLLSAGGLAVVGSRHLDKEAEDYTRQIAKTCANQGVPIVSGGARGADQIAMLSAVESGGMAIGILGDNLLRAALSSVYRQGLRQGRLTLVSAYYPDARFTVGNAMGRNKYIYAIADFALVISAQTQQGGTWAGAVEELRRKCPRSVFVRQEGDIPDGNRTLVKLGARPFPPAPFPADLKAVLAGKSARIDEMPSVKAKPAEQASLFGGLAMPEPLAEAAVKQTEAIFTATNPETDVSQPALAEPGAAGGIYEALLPLILDALGDWTTPTQLAATLAVRKNQLDDWLKLAQSQGHVQSKKRPLRYRRSGSRQ